MEYSTVQRVCVSATIVSVCVCVHIQNNALSIITALPQNVSVHYVFYLIIHF